MGLADKPLGLLLFHFACVSYALASTRAVGLLAREGKPTHTGELSEWLKVPDSKSGVLQGTGGSNPPLSAEVLSGLVLAEWRRQEGRVP
mgnify:CR=1 FL=1